MLGKKLSYRKKKKEREMYMLGNVNLIFKSDLQSLAEPLQAALMHII